MRLADLYEMSNRGMKSTVKDFKNLTELGGFGFARGITDKNEQKTPHYVMKKSLNMALENPIVSSALEQLIDFIFPGKRIRVASKHKKSQNWLNKWIELRPGLNDELYRFLYTNVACGNAGLQYSLRRDKSLDNVYCLNDISRVYFNPDHVGPEDEYVYAIPVTVREFKFDGKLQYPTFHNVKYIAGDAFFIKQVYGIPVSSDILKRYKTGWTREGYYGRSSLASNIDVDNIMTEILSSWDTISKLKQIDQKIITPDGNSTYDLSNQQYGDMLQQLEDGRGSYTFIPFPIKFAQQDIRTSKGYDTMVEVMEFLRRMIMMGLLPQHLTPWGDSSTTQGSEASLPPFLARVRSKQDEFIKILNNIVIGKLREDEPWIAKDATFVLDAPEVMGETYYIGVITNLKKEGIITTQQAIKWMNKIGIIRDDIFETEDAPEKIIDPFKVIDKDATSFKPNDTEAKTAQLRILAAIKQKEEEQKWKTSETGETTDVVDQTMNDNRDAVKKDITTPKDESKTSKDEPKASKDEPKAKKEDSK